MSTSEFDIAIIGSGPGGYVCAIRSAQLGLKTAIIEKDKTFGGTCLNVGCIPSKALLESSELYHLFSEDASKHGIVAREVNFDLNKMLARKDKIVGDLTNGISFLMKKNKVQTFKGKGKILKSATQSPSLGTHTIEITGADGTQKITAKNVICATGSIPSELPFLKFNEKNIVSSTGALSLPKVPNHLIVVGGGVIGLELGSVWLRLGAHVTVVEFMDRICPTMDQQTMTTLKKSLEKQGMKFITNAKVFSSQILPGTPDNSDQQVELEYEDRTSGAKQKIIGDVVLVSTGRRPYSDGLGLEDIGVIKDNRGFVQIDKHWETNVKGVFAIGDLVPGPMLAHKAEEEGVAVAEYLHGKNSTSKKSGYSGHVNYETVPSVIYTFPEVASVGFTEEQLKESNRKYKVGSFPFLANGRAKALGTTEGFVKILADAASDKILGGHIIGPRASELLGEIVVAMEFGGSSEDLARSFHAHPTLNEVVREAALGVDGRIRQM